MGHDSRMPYSHVTTRPPIWAQYSQPNPPTSADKSTASHSPVLRHSTPPFAPSSPHPHSDAISPIPRPREPLLQYYVNCVRGECTKYDLVHRPTTRRLLVRARVSRIYIPDTGLYPPVARRVNSPPRTSPPQGNRLHDRGLFQSTPSPSAAPRCL
jgi:hypothetical protein